jgi:hypothetical protein
MDKNDASGLRFFRQMKSEIRGSADYLLVGIDVAKDRHDAFFGSSLGLSNASEWCLPNLVHLLI